MHKDVEIGTLEKYRNCSVILLSFPKSGRIWVRYFIARYLEQKYSLQFNLELNSKEVVNVLNMAFSHNFFDAYPTDLSIPRIVGRQILLSKPLIVLLRDPRDVNVSYFYHLKYQIGQWNNGLASFSLSRQYGLERQAGFVLKLLDLYDIDPGRKLILRYEKMLEDEDVYFSQLIRFILDEPIDAVSFAHAKNYSSFEAMQSEEIRISKNKAIGKESRLGVDNWAGNKNALKVRSGKVGSYLNEREFRSTGFPKGLKNTKTLLNRLNEYD